MALITIMTDFGLKDGNVGVMKGVISGIAPSANVVDLTHQVSPQNVSEANYILTRSIPYFPPNTIHIFVVDPGVGTERRPMAAMIGDQYFIGPDNGAITGLINSARSTGVQCRFFKLDQPQYWLPVVSHVFHGRDIFSPAAAHLAVGVPVEILGTEFFDPVLITLPQPIINDGRIDGEIIYIDNFGSLVSNIVQADLKKLNLSPSDVIVDINGRSIHGMVNTFGERAPGSLVSLFSSTGVVIVSTVNGSARDEINGAVGNKITLRKNI